MKATHLGAEGGRISDVCLNLNCRHRGVVIGGGRKGGREGCSARGMTFLYSDALLAAGKLAGHSRGRELKLKHADCSPLTIVG